MNRYEALHSTDLDTVTNWKDVREIV